MVPPLRLDRRERDAAGHVAPAVVADDERVDGERFLAGERPLRLERAPDLLLAVRGDHEVGRGDDAVPVGRHGEGAVALLSARDLPAGAALLDARLEALL